MPKEIVERGATSQITHVFIPDTDSTTGGGKTGLSHLSSGLRIDVIRPGEAAITSYEANAGNLETIATIGTYQTPTASKARFAEIQPTGLPGWYEMHFADALFNNTSGRRSLGGMVHGAVGGAPTPFQIQLSDPILGVGSPSNLDSIYHADIQFVRDQANTQDEYSVTWYKNGARVTSGITSPTLQVVKRADGTDLIGASAMTQIGSTGSYKFDATGASRLTTGEAGLAIASGIIDSSMRSWTKIVGRDST